MSVSPQARRRGPALLRWIGACLILCSLVFPLYSCRGQAGSRQAPVKVYHYFFSDFTPKDPVDWFRLAGLLWPAAAAWGAPRLRRGRTLFRFAEPVLLCETALSLCLGAMFGTKEAGFWVGWAGVVGYGTGAAWADVERLEARKPHWRRAWRRLAAAGIVLAFLIAGIGSVLAFFNGFRS